MEVGEQLRLVRSRAGLSQRQLAKRAGITNSTISLVESNRTNPSVGALKRILDAIPISLADFFALETEETEKVVFGANELVEIGKGKMSCRQVGLPVPGRTLQILHERYEPGADSGRIPLSHSGQEGGIVISGTLELTVDAVRYKLGAGDAYYFDSRRPHRFRCLGNSPCQLVSACTPPSF